MTFKFVSISFTTVFLTVNHLHSTFASPIIVSNDASGVAAGQSLNLTHTLTKRDYTPVDHLCDNPGQWIARNCLTRLLDQAWVDFCWTNQGGDLEAQTTKLGGCPQGTMCMNTFSPPPDYAPTIICLIRPTGFTDSPGNNGGSTPNGQVGTEESKNSNTPFPVERIVSVPIEKNIRYATVSAFIEGMDGNYLVEPNAAMVGSLRGTTAKTCQYNETNRDCIPNGVYNLKSGNTIDFTFGLGPTQDVRFYYAIIGTLG